MGIELAGHHYSFLSREFRADGSWTLATALVSYNRLRFITDGLDELPAALARQAIDTLRGTVAERQHLLLSSRPTQYRDAVAAGPIVGAAGVVLESQRPAVVIALPGGQGAAVASPRRAPLAGLPGLVEPSTPLPA